MSISLATPRACLVSSDNFPSQASSMIWKIITRKDQRKNAQKKSIIDDSFSYLRGVNPKHINRLHLICFVIAWAKRRVPHVEQDLLTLPEHMRSPPVYVGVSVALVISIICCVLCTIICLFVFFFFSHFIVSLFSIYEFDCPAVLFSPLFFYILQRLYHLFSFLFSCSYNSNKFNKTGKVT